MNINLIRVAPCKICVCMVVNVHEVQNRRGSRRGWGWQLTIRNFSAHKNTSLKKNRSKPMNRRKKTNEMIKNNLFFFLIIVRTCNTLLFNILINKRIVKNNINRAVEINLVV